MVKHKVYLLAIVPHFHFTSTEKIAYRYCIQSIAKKWATYRQRLWNEFYDPTMRREALVNNVPDDVPRDQWACFVNYRLKPSTVERCMKNKENRSKQTIPHTCGSKSNSRRRHEIVYIYTYLYLETGKKPSRGMMYIETHKRKDGSFVNNEALTIVANDAESEPTTPFDARRSVGDSNGHPRTNI
ncbi:uncharacterized protein [Arachis hypogaea]|uniref:uncharacterized protein isoform X2 n=1 Tax=Arachis hypogaea TaxID=3818 RepID=UPI003B213F84